jgi:hypothetical protein
MEAGVLIRYLKISVKEREIGEKKKKDLISGATQNIQPSQNSSSLLPVSQGK